MKKLYLFLLLIPTLSLAQIDKEIEEEVFRHQKLIRNLQKTVDSLRLKIGQTQARPAQTVELHSVNDRIQKLEKLVDSQQAEIKELKSKERQSNDKQSKKAESRTEKTESVIAEKNSNGKIADSKYDFRAVQWGMSVAEVKSSEKTKPSLENKTGVYYRNQRAGVHPADLMYFFKEGKLIGASYTIGEEHSEKQLFIEDFLDVNSILIGKFGDPTRKNEKWINTLYKDDPSKHGLAISAGQLSYIWVWESERTRIGHVMSGDNFEIKHTLHFDQKGQTVEFQNDSKDF